MAAIKPQQGFNYLLPQYVRHLEGIARANNGVLPLSCLLQRRGVVLEYLQAMAAWRPAAPGPMPDQTIQDLKDLCRLGWFRRAARVLSTVAELQTRPCDRVLLPDALLRLLEVSGPLVRFTTRDGSATSASEHEGATHVEHWVAYECCVGGLLSYLVGVADYVGLCCTVEDSDRRFTKGGSWDTLDTCRKNVFAILASVLDARWDLALAAEESSTESSDMERAAPYQQQLASALNAVQLERLVFQLFEVARLHHIKGLLMNVMPFISILLTTFASTLQHTGCQEGLERLYGAFNDERFRSLCFDWLILCAQTAWTGATEVSNSSAQIKLLNNMEHMLRLIINAYMISGRSAPNPMSPSHMSTLMDIAMLLHTAKQGRAKQGVLDCCGICTMLALALLNNVLEVCPDGKPRVEVVELLSSPSWVQCMVLLLKTSLRLCTLRLSDHKAGVHPGPAGLCQIQHVQQAVWSCLWLLCSLLRPRPDSPSPVTPDIALQVAEAHEQMTCQLLMRLCDTSAARPPRRFRLSPSVGNAALANRLLDAGILPLVEHALRLHAWLELGDVPADLLLQLDRGLTKAIEFLMSLGPYVCSRPYSTATLSLVATLRKCLNTAVFDTNMTRRDKDFHDWVVVNCSDLGLVLSLLPQRALWAQLPVQHGASHPTRMVQEASTSSDMTAVSAELSQDDRNVLQFIDLNCMDAMMQQMLEFRKATGCYPEYGHHNVVGMLRGLLHAGLWSRDYSFGYPTLQPLLYIVAAQTAVPASMIWPYASALLSALADAAAINKPFALSLLAVKGTDGTPGDLVFSLLDIAQFKLVYDRQPLSPERERIDEITIISLVRLLHNICLALPGDSCVSLRALCKIMVTDAGMTLVPSQPLFAGHMPTNAEGTAQLTGALVVTLAGRVTGCQAEIPHAACIAMEEWERHLAISDTAGHHSSVCAQRLAAEQVGCFYVGCTNLSGPSEVALKTSKCARCLRARYCSAACQKADFKSHKDACKELAKQRQT